MTNDECRMTNDRRRRSVFGNYRSAETGRVEDKDPSFPVTSALSPRERETTDPVSRQSERAAPTESRTKVPPLPEGEGRGEGEGRFQISATLQSSIDTSVARAFLYRYLAKAFEDPEPDGWEWLCHEETKRSLRAASDAVAKSEVRNPTARFESLSGFSPLTPALSPLKGEGVAIDAHRLSTASRSIPARSSQEEPIPDAAGRNPYPEAAHRAPSPLNGERAGVRGEADPQRDPSPSFAFNSCTANFLAPILASTEQLLHALTPSAYDEFSASHLTCFGHTVRGDCPMNEIEYGDIKADPLFQPHRLADLGAFYAAFGLEVTPDAAERIDHISIELEFMSVLAAKEAYALEHQLEEEQLTMARDAQKKFLREHFGRWTPAFTRRLARMAGDGGLGRLANFAREFILLECARLGVTPGSEDLLLRPIDEAAERLCASCGVTSLPPDVSVSPAGT
jgi:hypothetical protein